MDSKENKEILNIFNIADELSILKLLEYPINKLGINIDKNYNFTLIKWLCLKFMMLEKSINFYGTLKKVRVKFYL